MNEARHAIPFDLGNTLVFYSQRAEFSAILREARAEGFHTAIVSITPGGNLDDPSASLGRPPAWGALLSYGG